MRERRERERERRERERREREIEEISRRETPRYRGGEMLTIAHKCLLLLYYPISLRRSDHSSADSNQHSEDICSLHLITALN